eukprot:scaffold118730_cov48-Cyclotella_meneghiniana.AAC.1
MKNRTKTQSEGITSSLPGLSNNQMLNSRHSRVQTFRFLVQIILRHERVFHLRVNKSTQSLGQQIKDITNRFHQRSRCSTLQTKHMLVP